MPLIVRKLLLLVLGIPFVMIGTRFLLDSAESVYTYQRSSAWTAVQAVLTSVERFSGGDQAFGNETVAHYRYEVEGQKFDGQFSCVGDECPQENLYTRLETARNQNQTVSVLANPDSPHKSLLFRHLSVGMLLFKVGVGLFCFLTGSAGVIFGVYLLRGQAKRQ